MKIKRIKIENFKSIDNLEYNINNTTAVLIGENGIGKTAFKEAFYAGITGDFPDNCIRSGYESCVVEIVLEDGTSYKRVQNSSKANKVYLDGKPSTAKTINEHISAKTGLSKDFLKIILSADILQSVQPAEFGKFITSYIPEKLNIERVLSFVPTIKENAKNILLAKLPAMPQTFGISKLDDIFNDFVEERKIIKRDIAVKDAKIKSFSGIKPERTLEEIETSLTETIKKQGEQNAEKTTILMYNDALQKKHQAEENIRKLKEDIDKIEATEPDKTVLDKIQYQKAELNKIIVNARSTYSTLKNNVSMLENTLKNLNKPVCPISEKLVCTTDKTHVKEEINTLIKENLASMEAQKEIGVKASENIKKLEATENAYRENEKSYAKKMQMEDNLTKLMQNIPVLPARPQSLKMIDYASLVKALQSERDICLAYMQYEKDVKEKENLMLCLADYEFLCDTFNAKGKVMQNITSNYFGIFESVCNECSEQIRKGFRFKFYANNGVSYVIKTNEHSDYKPLASLSSGEKMLALFSIIHMLNSLTGLKMIMLDDLDKLDKNAFEELINIVQSNYIQSQYDLVLLSMVNHDDLIDIVDKNKIDKIFGS